MKTAEEWSRDASMDSIITEDDARAIQEDALEAAAGQIDGWSPANRAIQKAIRNLIPTKEKDQVMLPCKIEGQ